MSVQALRRGAIAASRVQAPTTVTALSLPGTAGNYVSTPDSAANSISGDLDIRIKAAVTNWSGDGQALIAKLAGSGQLAWALFISSGGVVTFLNSTDGSSWHNVVQSNALGFTNGTAHWVRVAFQPAAGSIQFYTSSDGASWTSNKSTTAATGGTFNSSAIVSIGGDVFDEVLTGTVYYAEIRSGIDGTVVNKYDPSAVTILGTRNPSTLVSSTGETWTMNGSAWDWATV